MAIPVVHLVYSTTHKGYHLYDLNSKEFFVSRDTVFQEDIYPFKDMRTGSSPMFPVLELLEPDSPGVTTPLPPVIDNISQSSQNSFTREPTSPPHPVQLRRSSRESRPPI